MIVANPIMLVKDGNILHEALLKARISRDEFESYLRLSGTDDISDIKTSYLEINGQVSFIKKKQLGGGKKTETTTRIKLIVK
jgi:uncharacterized membrane protein YcaP (DUF421 family)